MIGETGERKSAVATPDGKSRKKKKKKIERKGDRRKRHFRRDPERRLDAFAAAAEPWRGAYAARRPPLAPASDPISVPPRQISYH